jgi:predicted AlkP superfamily phosphohydrolase/phosphomutase
MIDRFLNLFPDKHLIIFNLHGMGPNNSDVASMVLLPELLYRREFGCPLMRDRSWPTTGSGVPVLTSSQDWGAEIARLFLKQSSVLRRARQKLARVLGRMSKEANSGELTLDWMPATRYRHHWPRMRAFALPSFYDGRIRINLKGREAAGRVEPSEYEAVCDELEELLRVCRDPLRGTPVVDQVYRHDKPDPLQLNGSEADLIVTWATDAPLGFSHPELGTIGPLPYRRTGGHTGEHGIAYIRADDAVPGAYGIRSAFDVVPTVVELLEAGRPRRLSGRTLLNQREGL